MENIFSLFLRFLRIGLFSIGGGYAVLPLIKEQIVTLEQWLTLEEFTDIIIISQMTPGPLAVNASTFVGLRIAGISGAIAATFGCILFGISLSLLFYRFFNKYKDSVYISSILKGLRAASFGLIFSASIQIVIPILLKNAESFSAIQVDWKACFLFLFFFLTIRLKKLYLIKHSKA